MSIKIVNIKTGKYLFIDEKQERMHPVPYFCKKGCLENAVTALILLVCGATGNGGISAK